ncbi:MAG: hypothetical protein AAF742_08910 [Pseudomonadota bacterium]
MSFSVCIVGSLNAGFVYVATANVFLPSGSPDTLSMPDETHVLCRLDLADEER